MKNEMKKTLGLDLGTNSIGWALIERNFKEKVGKIKGLGSRIIPMDKTMMDKFGSGGTIETSTAARTGYRGTRRLYQRDNLRRERLHRTLNVLGFLPQHYSTALDFNKHLGQFKKGAEVKLNYRKNKQGKHEFIFMDSFYEMVNDFKGTNPDLFYTKSDGRETKISYDWTLYFLRTKALTKKITKEELAWLILNFNQKRGYYQLRGEEEVTEEKTKEFIVTTSTNKDGTRKRSYKSVDSERDWLAIKAKTQQDIDRSKKYIGQYIYDSLKENPTIKIRGKLIKTIERYYYKNEFEAIIKEQLKHHSELQDKKLYAACVEELYPRNEAHQKNIKDKGFEYLFTDDIIFYQRPLKSKKSTISTCQYEIRSYKCKEIDKVTNLKKVVWRQEGLKAIPKSHPLFQEFRLWQFLKNLRVFKKEDGEGNLINVEITSDLLKIEEDWAILFSFLNVKKEIDQKQLIQYFISKNLIKKSDKENYRWNYVEDKKYPCNTTKSQFISRLQKVKNVEALSLLTTEVEYNLWHIIYSVKDKNEFKAALGTFANRYEIDKDTFVESFKKHPPFISDYGAYSEKAIKKLLSLMRRGSYFTETLVSEECKERITNIMARVESLRLNEDYSKDDLNEALALVSDDDIPKQLIKSFVPFKNTNPLTALNTYQACYAVYNRYSELKSFKASVIAQWKKPQDITLFLNDFKQHSLRNPIVEQVVTETLRTVRDIWINYGNGAEGYFSKIHVELGREMKNPKGRREAISKRNIENENTNHRIKYVLQELMNEGVSEVKPYSPSQQEILKIYEEGIYQNSKTNYNQVSEEDILKIRKSSSPTKNEIERYKLWLEQGYISPYTGQTIQLSRLFSIDYEIEHIIPQSRYFDNSLGNKVICESEINRDKSNMTAYEYIVKKGGSIVAGFPILGLDEYKNHCNQYFKTNRTKLRNLLSEDIPEGFINRQLNDSRYISKLIKGLLGNLVREENEKEATSKNIIPVTGAITSKLKRDWGLNDKWNELVAPRFMRLNEMTDSKGFGDWDFQKDNNGKETGKKFFRTQVPDEISKGFNKKRIDHRHHALDALVIACCTRKHTQYLSSLNSEKKNDALRESLLKKNEKGDYTKHFLLPWSDFPTEAKSSLDITIISFKQNLRVINKTNNKTWKWEEKEGQFKKVLVKQTKGDNCAIRKPIHQDTVSGKVTLFRKRKKAITFSKSLDQWKTIANKEVKQKVKSAIKLFDNDLKKVKKHFKDNPIKIEGNAITHVFVYEEIEATARRTALSEKFTRKDLERITDLGIQKILKNHIKNYLNPEGKEQFGLAFSVEGVQELNKNILQLNNGKKHQPIYKVRLFEVGSKFPISEDKNSAKNKKYVEAAKGTNLFFAVYWDDEKKKRVYTTVPLNEVIEHQKQEAKSPKIERTAIPIDNSKGQFLFSLSPNDLVYIPTDEEIENINSVNFKNLKKEQVERVYKMVSCTGGECHFIPNRNATEIKKNENGTNSKSERIQNFNKIKILDNKGKPIMIKERCWKLKIDRLGNITKVLR